MKRHKSLRIICNMETDEKILKLQQKLVGNSALAQEYICSELAVHALNCYLSSWDNKQIQKTFLSYSSNNLHTNATHTWEQFPLCEYKPHKDSCIFLPLLGWQATSQRGLLASYCLLANCSVWQHFIYTWRNFQLAESWAISHQSRLHCSQPPCIHAYPIIAILKHGR